MIIGYARTSTAEQKFSIEAQIEELKEAKAEKIFHEQVSSVAERPEFQQLLDFARFGDSIVVTKLDRAFRSVRHMNEIVEYLTEKGVSLQILNMNLDTSSATGKLMLNLLASFAQFEREIMKERQREGIEKAKAEGKYKGRPKKGDPEQVREMHESGMKISQITKLTGISRITIWRYLNE